MAGLTRWPSRRRLLSAMLSLGVLPLAACVTSTPRPTAHGPLVAPAATTPLGGSALIARPERNEWPEMWRRAPVEVQEAYRYAVANQQILRYFPCFCGCYEEARHTSNVACYVSRTLPDGAVVLDAMSFT